MSQSNLPFGFWFTMEKTKKILTLVYKFTPMNHKVFLWWTSEFITRNQNPETIHVSLFLQHNFNIRHLVPYTWRIMPNKTKTITTTITQVKHNRRGRNTYLWVR
jgi:hypothetical protein